MTAPNSMPKTLGRYEIQGELGRGMMGVVYRAHDPALGRKVALKTVSDHFARSLPENEREHFDQRFLAEARAAAALSHPGIIGVHDVGRDPDTGTLFIALEYLQGQTLGQRLARGPLDWKEALRLTQRVAEALNHAHAQGIVHRDIKPANIMILESGEPKVMDFGIAKIPESELTGAGQVFGTPLFMSPEQASGTTLDGRSDLFSLGAVLYNLLTQRHGFDAGSLPAIITKVLHHEPDPPSFLNPLIPKSVDYVVARLLAKSPERRYPDGRTVAEDLQDILQDRAPRHRAAWESQVGGAHGLATSPPGEPGASPLEALIETVHPPSLPNGPAAETVRQSSQRRSLGPLWFQVSAVALALALLLGVVHAARARWSGGATESASTPSPGISAEPPSLIDRVGSAFSLEENARISFGLEHSAKAVSLRVWVDDNLVVEKNVYGRLTRKILGMESYKGSFQEVLDVKSGRHDIKVRVAWDNNAKTETISGTLKPGVTRRLEADLGGIRKSLSLEWK